MMAETLRRDEAELRKSLFKLGPDGLEAAKLAANFMNCRGKFREIADLMKTAAGRIVLMLEQMEAEGVIETTDAIYEPLNTVYGGIGKPPH